MRFKGVYRTSRARNEYVVSSGSVAVFCELSSFEKFYFLNEKYLKFLWIEFPSYVLQSEVMSPKRHQMIETTERTRVQTSVYCVERFFTMRPNVRLETHRQSSYMYIIIITTGITIIYIYRQRQCTAS